MKPPRGKRVDPQSRSAEFSAARGPGLPPFGILAVTGGEPAAVPSRTPPRALSADREPQPVWDVAVTCRDGLSVGGARVPYQPAPVSRRQTEEPPSASRPPSLPGEFDWERLGNRVSRPLTRDRRGAGRAIFVGWWQVCRHSTRPVLKHGPRSLTCARVIGSYETQRRSESEGPSKRPRWDPFLSPPPFTGGWGKGMAHHRPVPSASSVGRSKSVHAGTRKMVNYA